ncbi:hypothetical protein A3L11_03590 [Thermococcus siculi]|uniref:Glucodextranase-like C-terminal domain-containing protein n=2 Tax=Thermococcus siculi TaxID=72803 RepID=A0A2Z2MIU3_9EURY|nr:hypothetical protein A3L11_03590 [Thermococcus siculi]
MALLKGGQSMKRFAVLIMALMVLGGMMGMVSAHTVTVDGDPSDWTASTWNQNINTAQLYQDVGEWVWKDAAEDERTVFANPDKRVDILEFRITADDTYLYFMIRFNDLDVVGEEGAPGIMITIDTDQGQDSGEVWFGYLSDTKVASDGNANWEYQILVDLANSQVQDGQPVYGDGVPVWNGGSPLDVIQVQNNEWVDISTSDDEFVASTTNDVVEIRVKKSELGDPSTIRVELGVVRENGSANALDPDGGSGSDVLDAMTDATSTEDEVSDGAIDYYEDINISSVPFFSNAAVILAIILGVVVLFRKH